MRKMLFVAAITFGGVALLHAAALVFPRLLEPEPAWRHALFVVINGAVAVGLFLRPRAFPFLFAVLVAQQIYSHGTYASAEWQAHHHIALMSLAVMLFMPAVLAILIVEMRRNP